MRPPARVLRFVFGGFAALHGVTSFSEEKFSFEAGVARVDITPTHPVRLSGYGTRREESTQAAQALWAKAIAVGIATREPFLLLTVDNCGVPAWLREGVLRRLGSAGVTSERFALTFTHTHSAPCLTGALVNIFAEDIPPAHQANVDRYTRDLADKLVQVSLAALADRRPARLEWSSGKLRFAQNRRTLNGGVVDHDFPLLAVRTPAGALRALFASYACHSTALGGDFNEAHGDWAGSAQLAIEADHPGAVALIALGAAGECIPTGVRELPPPQRLAETSRLGRTVADEARRLLDRGLRPITGAPEGRVKSVDLPLVPLPIREEWLARLRQAGPGIAYHARKNLARLDRGEKLPTHVPYLVQSWSFGRDLTMVFLPGEVVGDYSLRLKREFDSDRFWFNAYSNAAPAYIPSRRVLALGQYEATTSTRYYDLPASFAPEVEELIVDAVHDVVPRAYLAATRSNPLPRATTPEEALAALRVSSNLTVQLVASEPMILDPVAIEFGSDGRLWVVEMRDYPQGIDGKWKPGGRIRVLTDTDHDGRFDQTTDFMDDIPFPTGVLPWRKGVLVCAAPDILYAEDTDGDGRADLIRKVLTGFSTDNYQARVNSLTIGLDNWVHAANGLRGGVIYNPERPGRKIDIRGQDIRFQPDTGVFETIAGRSQYGRVRDDWGNWFSTTAGNLLLHFPLAVLYARRNPHGAVAAGAVQLPSGPQRSQVYPISDAMKRFNQPAHANQVTAACGPGLYRDVLLGEQFYGNAFVCEPAHSIVTRIELTPRGATFSGERAENEKAAEFLASTSSWFTPVQARTGPDGALWIVDMARPVIEHPRWIPPERLQGLPVRAGDDMGRIFRVQRKGATLRPIADLTKLDLSALIAALDTPNGDVRDRVQRELLFRGSNGAIPPLERIATISTLAVVRLHALALIDTCGGLSVERVTAALLDSDPRVRRFALVLGERFLKSPSVLDPLLVALSTDPDLGVRTQLAFSLGEWHDAISGARLLGEVAVSAPDDPWVRTAVITSATKDPLGILTRISSYHDGVARHAQLAADLCRTAIAIGTPVDALLPIVAPPAGAGVTGRHLIVLAGLQDGADAHKIRIENQSRPESPAVADALARIRAAYAQAARVAQDTGASLSERQAAVRLLSRGFNDFERNLPVLVGLLDGAEDPALIQTALEMIRRSASAQVPAELLGNWNHFPPSVRPTVVDILSSRDDWSDRLLSAIEKGILPSSAVPAANRQRLLRLAQSDLQSRARSLFASAGSTNRQAVIDRYKVVSQLSGDARHGVQVFNQTCSACHVFVGTNSVGPPLGTYRDKGVADFLIAILDPNAAIEPKYTAYTVTLKDGRALAGVISEESAAGFILTMPGNINQRIGRQEVSAIAALGTSLMPDGLEAGLSEQDMADLIAYLTSNR
jgi:putative membrane-bound dehydrogenase-like protein